MRIESLKLIDFRKFNQFEILCHPKINCIIGENGTGKTSILEAIWTTVATTSFRTHKVNHLIQAEKKEAEIKLSYETNDVSQFLSFRLKGSKREAHHNNHKLANLAGLIGLLLAVVISTEDLDLIEGDPAKRRYFLDLMLSQIDPFYLWHLRRYTKGLKAKNQLLKSHHLKPIASFEKEMAKSAAYISKNRAKLIDDLSAEGAPILKALTQKDSFFLLDYQIWEEEELLQKWAKDRPQEIKLGYTLSGPHKDDLKIYHDGKEAKHFASMGEKKSLMIALKIAQYRQIQKRTDCRPILLVDDYSSHLDQNRQENFFKILELEGQVFLTNPHLIPFMNSGLVISL